MFFRKLNLFTKIYHTKVNDGVDLSLRRVLWEPCLMSVTRPYLQIKLHT